MPETQHSEIAKPYEELATDPQGIVNAELLRAPHLSMIRTEPCEGMPVRLLPGVRGSVALPGG